MPPVIRVKNLSKQFGSLSVLKDVSFDVEQGKVAVLLGPSGSGKTTLLRCLNNLTPIDKGVIEIAGFEVTPNPKETEMRLLRKKVGMVSQSFNLWPHKTVLENVIEAPIKVMGLAREDAVKQARLILRQIELIDKENEYPKNLSGGQQQRVAIARALSTKPEILLLDEITSALDPELVGSVLRTIKLLAKNGQTMVVVTHHLSFALQIADEIIFLDNGILLQESNPRDFMYAQNDNRIREFIKTIPMQGQEINVFEGYDEFQAYHLGLMKRLPEDTVIYVGGSSGDRWFECMGDYYEQYEKIRIQKRIVWQMLLYNYSKLDKDLKERYPKYNSYRIIKKDYDIPANFNVMQDIVIIQIFDRDKPAIIEIRDADLSRSYLNYFNLLWGQAKEV